jgi:hypothetical protein
VFTKRVATMNTPALLTGWVYVPENLPEILADIAPGARAVVIPHPVDGRCAGNALVTLRPSLKINAIC